MQAVSEILPSTTSQVHDVAEFRDLSDPAYRAELRALRVHLLSLQEWVVANNKRLAVVLEGRDAVGKGKLSAGITHYLNPKFSRIVAQGTPTPQAMRNWLGRHHRVMPQEWEIVIFDRSWYSRAMIQLAMGYCSMRQYHYFMNRVNDWEQKLVDEGITLIKLYLSVSQDSQDLRFKLRKTSDLQYWKYSANDRMAAERWQLLTYFKERMFAVTSTDYAPLGDYQFRQQESGPPERNSLYTGKVRLRGQRACPSVPAGRIGGTAGIPRPAGRRRPVYRSQ